MTYKGRILGVPGLLGSYLLPGPFCESSFLLCQGSIANVIRNTPFSTEYFFIVLTGFNVHSQVRAESTSEAERVGKYMIRPVLSLKRLFFDATAGKVRYQYSRHGSQEESMDYLEFIARVTSHLPDKGQAPAILSVVK
jgi:hypothetical protein